MGNIFKHMFSFTGRCGRLEYIIHSVADVLIIFGTVMLVAMIDSSTGSDHSSSIFGFGMITVLIIGGLAEMAATIRRFHD